MHFIDLNQDVVSCTYFVINVTNIFTVTSVIVSYRYRWIFRCLRCRQCLQHHSYNLSCSANHCDASNITERKTVIERARIKFRDFSE
jgi:hypothetical protein